MEWGPVLRAYRNKHHIFQKDLAKTLGVSPPQLSKIESGLHEPGSLFAIRALKLLIPTLENDLLLLEIQAERRRVYVSTERVTSS